MHESSNRIAEVFAPAKINLALIVGPRRSDGFHPICSVMEKIKLFDTLQTMPEAEGTGIRLTGSGLPADLAPGENMVMLAARALERETGRRLDVDIELKKTIPVAAGLGGGSSDAAAILKLLVFHLELDVPPQRLEALALELGADVPFFLAPGPQLAGGIGEQLQPLPGGLPDYALVLVKPAASLSTAAVYEEFDRLAGQTGRELSGQTGSRPGAAEDFDTRCRRLREKTGALAGASSPGFADGSSPAGPEALAEIMENDLEAAVAELFPALGEIKRQIVETGALAALMSGSGSTVFGIFPDIGAARTAARALGGSFPRVWALEPLRA
ncbi:MAG: 4-(cytidine 5'-diphospho)-2-C-methyl-D-erythritol kinase [Actinobacteria bacterium]|nr:4-(cytidine 5'-diphospho)-2-C-methyl-D-erythritol kinase [Actinomycetota bacterium]